MTCEPWCVIHTEKKCSPRPTSAPPLRAHHLWPVLIPFLKIQRHRIELKRETPDYVVDLVSSMKVRCVDCVREIAPLRVRQKPGNKRSKTVGHGLFLAVACPLGPVTEHSGGTGCSRGKDDTAELQSIRKENQAYEARVMAARWTATSSNQVVMK